MTASNRLNWRVVLSIVPAWPSCGMELDDGKQLVISRNYQAVLERLK